MTSFKAVMHECLPQFSCQIEEAQFNDMTLFLGSSKLPKTSGDTLAPCLLVPGRLLLLFGFYFWKFM